jgi:hypothetical protein
VPGANPTVIGLVASSARVDRPWFKKKRFVIPAGLAGLIILGSAAGAGGTEQPETPVALKGSPSAAAVRTPSVAATTTPTPTATPSATPSATPTAAAPKPVAPKPVAPKPVAPKPAAPTLSVAQQNAKGTAEDYLDYSGFSKKGLIEQLEFEGYKAKDITAALATMKVDWNAEAAESAKAYVDYSHFSRSGLIEQLKFEGYSSKQAAHGADSVGL